MTPAPLTKTLEFEKKNQKMPKLPKHVKVQKRPIPHPSTPSPYSGSSSPKTIYVSSSSPTMGVVKRVQKYLRAAENRAMAKLLSGNNKGKKGDRRNQIAQLAQSNEALKKEEVFVKATGRAMERALKAGKWFEARGEEYTVSVKTGSVLVVDDVVEDKEERKKAVEESERLKKEVEEAKLKDGNGDLSKSAMRKRKRAVARLEGEEELPETRTSRQAQFGFSRFPAPRTAAMDLDLVPIVRFPGVTTTAAGLPWKILPVTQRLPSIHMHRALSSNTQAWSAIDLIEVWVFFTYNGTAIPLAV
ncbi:hypothetical protein AtubIFM61612_001536 [Aspergillus tubingensis]|nr:hypothetical protein AtubIFM61612_001536 [Aspergillus tubingensis]